MSQHNEIHVRVRLEVRTGKVLLGSGRAIQRRRITRLVCQRPRHEIHQPEPEIRMQPAEQCGCHWPARHAMHRPRHEMAFRQPVSVSQKRPPASQRDRDAPAVELRTELLAPELATPAVVVAARHGDADTAATDPVQGTERGERVPRNDGAILEPEVEQVAVHNEVRPQIRHHIQETVKRRSGRLRRVSQVGVGDDHDGFGQHGGSILRFRQHRHA